jgi:hypothetical protein
VEKSELMILMFMMLGIPLLMIPYGYLFYKYMRYLFLLISSLEQQYPDKWIELGSPIGSSFQHTSPDRYCTTYYTVTPFLPIFRWLLSKDFNDLNRELNRLAMQTRRYMLLSLLALMIMFCGAGLFIYLVEFA